MINQDLTGGRGRGGVVGGGGRHRGVSVRKGFCDGGGGFFEFFWGGEGSYRLFLIEGRHGDVEGEGSKVGGGVFLFRVLGGVEVLYRFLGGLSPTDV